MLGRYALVAAMLATGVFADVQASPLSIEALDNATVQPAGPRAGANGKNFFNVEGSANAAFASYGVADFNFGALPAVISVNSISISFVQSNAAFSTTGPITFSLDTRAPLSDIQPGTSPLAFDGVDPGTTTDAGQGDLVLLAFGGGPFVYTVGTTGDVNTYPLGLTPPNAAALVNRLNSGSTIRIVVGTGVNNVAATWAGFSNTTFAGPTLNLDVTFESTATHSNTWGRLKSLYR